MQTVILTQNLIDLIMSRVRNIVPSGDTLKAEIDSNDNKLSRCNRLIRQLEQGKPLPDWQAELELLVDEQASYPVQDHKEALRLLSVTAALGELKLRKLREPWEAVVAREDRLSELRYSLETAVERELSSPDLRYMIDGIIGHVIQIMATPPEFRGTGCRMLKELDLFSDTEQSDLTRRTKQLSAELEALLSA